MVNGTLVTQFPLYGNPDHGVTLEMHESAQTCGIQLPRLSCNERYIAPRGGLVYANCTVMTRQHPLRNLRAFATDLLRMGNQATQRMPVQAVTSRHLAHLDATLEKVGIHTCADLAAKLDQIHATESDLDELREQLEHMNLITRQYRSEGSAILRMAWLAPKENGFVDVLEIVSLAQRFNYLVQIPSHTLLQLQEPCQEYPVPMLCNFMGSLRTSPISAIPWKSTSWPKRDISPSRGCFGKMRRTSSIAWSGLTLIPWLTWLRSRALLLSHSAATFILYRPETLPTFFRSMASHSQRKKPPPNPTTSNLYLQVPAARSSTILQPVLLRAAFLFQSPIDKNVKLTLQ
jgi:hypothetical protein